MSPTHRTSISCGSNYIDKTRATEKCVTRKDCTGIPDDKGKLCLPDDEYNNWRSYKVYLLVNGEDRSYVDLDTCLDMENRYAYRYGECSLLAPDNNEGYGFYKVGDQVYYCDWLLLTLLDKVMWISYTSCISKFSRV